MTPLDAALRYSVRWPVFPCIGEGTARKRPHTWRGFHDASNDQTMIREWWTRWPNALIGCPTGRINGFVVLDIDIKNGVNGYDALEDIDDALPLADAPIAHTASGGVHIYFDPNGQNIRSSAGKLGGGLDVRGDGGYIVLPSPGSGYSWDPHCNFKTVALAPAPTWLTPAEPKTEPSAAPVPPAGEIAPYGAAAINSAVSAIYSSPCGQQQITMNREAYGIGQLVGAGVLPESVAFGSLLQSALAMPSYDPRRPWRRAEVERCVRVSFEEGRRRPRYAR